MPTVFNTHIDGQFDKLVTENVTSLPHFLSTALETIDMTTDMVVAHQN